MKYSLYFLSVCSLFGANIANPSQFEPLKDFKPPKLITPENSQNYGVENQFDNASRDYYFITDKIDNSIDPWHLSSLIYGKNFYNSALFKFREANYYTIFNANHTKANGYKDGSGNEVNFGYERLNQSAILGYVPNDIMEYKLVFIHDDITDDKQPQHQMDAVKTERFVTKFNSRFGQDDLSNTANFDFTYINLERKANNFDLRPVANSMVFMNVDRDIYEFALKYDNDFGAFHNTIGISYAIDEHTAKRYAKTAKGDILNAYRFGDVKQNIYKIFDTLSYKFNEFHKFSLGVDYTYNDAKIDKFDEKLPNPAGGYFPNPKMLYQKYYGINFDGKVDIEAFSSKLRYDFTPNELQQYYGEIAHIERIATNNERFASLNGTASMASVSNPFIKPEAHNFIKLGLDLKNSHYKSYLNSLNANGVNLGGYIMADDVKNLIIYDRARGQSGILQTDNGIITRNVDAKIYSANAFVYLNFMQNFGTKLNLTYAYGNNDTDDRALYQIRPFEANLNFDYKNYASFGSYNFGSGLRYVAKQNRGDFDKNKGFGIDLEEAAKEFATFDLYAGINFKDKYGIKFGVNNIFDKNYAEFISANHVEAMAPTLVNAPGRTFYISFHGKF
ncbi:TonB-dependent receptor domain-containing protein [Campylobacter hyointestinalis]|uniref:TonB-dependent receptor domain-containing protein n=1 Tax=Campylobacter hyointestinalis TaxID=198 RepID=UPI000DCBD4C1|nr:TonB-dependent receptor [Campylobacter hyointestinalis]RAZ59238.1 TonB-dependent receptor [Campylobacter hyointestinalis subsp. lawsonii]